MARALRKEELECFVEVGVSEAFTCQCLWYARRAEIRKLFAKFIEVHVRLPLSLYGSCMCGAICVGLEWYGSHLSGMAHTDAL